MKEKICDKQMLRGQLKAMLKSLDHSYNSKASLDILDNIVALPEYKNAKVIFLFVGTKNEIDTSLIIERALCEGKRVCVPKCHKLGIMDAYEISGLDDLELGKYDIREPKNHCRLACKESIDLALIPCLSCNLKGHRLGYGAGFYDRYLEKSSFDKVVLCRERMLCEDIPMDSHDIKMDIVVTENVVVRL